MIHRRPSAPRRGIAMVVVVAMLALFAIVALGFVFYAESDSAISRISREAQASIQADVDPDLLLSYFLGQLIYDTNDPYSALRSHGLTTGMYGYGSSTFIPFNGVGRGANYTQALDYTQYSAARTVETGLNAPWTYPDKNNVLLAAVDANGKVLIPSGSRGNTATNWLRPSTTHHTAFNDGASTTTGCAVRNLEGGPNVSNANDLHDSMWIDIGFPVLTAPDGRKFKPLFAPLLISLDNRVNLMVAGNRFSGSSVNRSLHGLSRYEISLDKVLTDTTAIGKLFRNASYSHYGNTATSNPDGTLPNMSAPYYAPFDFDAATTSADPYPKLPGMTSGPANSIFPTFPTTFKSGSFSAAAGHPALFSYPVKINDDVNRISLSNMEPLLRYGGTNSGSFSSLFPQILGSDWNTLQKRMLVTLISNGVDRPLWMPMTNTNSYQMAATDLYPKLNTLPQFQAGTTSTPKLRIDLNRQLTDFPVNMDPMTGMYLAGDIATAKKAMTERQDFAKEIYERLVEATGALANPGAIASTQPDYPKYLASRYLAQLAVNIVDYIDADDVVTPLAWNQGTNDVVFGAEMPKLVINEAYSQLDNDADDPDIKTTTAPKKASRYQLNAWVELFNPGKSDVKLYRNSEAVYQLVVFDHATITDTAKFPNRVPITMAVDATTKVPNDSEIFVERFISDTMAPAVPMNVAHAGDGLTANDVANKKFPYFVVGPNVVGATGSGKDTDANTPAPVPMASTFKFLTDRDPKIDATLLSSQIFKVYRINDPANPPKTPEKLTYVLRRLANPNFKNNESIADLTNPAAAVDPYNPYITVDYIEAINVNDNREYDEAKDIDAGKIKLLRDFKSTGRRQPFRALNLEDQGIVPPPASPTRTVQEDTFGKQNRKVLKINNVDKDNALDYDTAANTTGDAAYTPIQWMVHLDRPLLNLFELKHVSAQAPHLLTQRFFDSASPPNAFKHTAPWTQQDAMLFRAFELFGLKDRMVNTPFGGQVAGKININEIWDKEILRALFDAQAGVSSFADADVDALFSALQSYRENGSTVPSASSRPFTGFGVGVYDPASTTTPPTQGINSTLLNIHGGNPALLKSQPIPSAASPHPYFKDEMLSKIMNNVAFTSNTFALWVTVGFFEVTDDSVRPARLGTEIGRSENRQVRHRFFAIIDRTETSLLRGTVKTAVSPGTGAKIYYNAVASASGVAAPAIQNGALIDIGVERPDLGTPPANEVPEVVVVTGSGSDMGGNYFTADVKQTHSAGAHIVWRGNPGPWPRYDPRQDAAVVPYFNIIE